MKTYKLQMVSCIRKILFTLAFVVLFAAGLSTSASAASSSVKAVTSGKSFKVTGYTKVKSSKTGVVKVSKSATNQYKATARKKGTATLTCYKNGKAVKKIYVIVTTSGSFKYNTSNISLTEGKSKTVKATVQSKCTVKYSSSNKKVAKVSSKGKITAVKAGTAVIRAKVYYKGKVIKTFKKTVVVKKKSTAVAVASGNTSSDDGNTSEKFSQTETESNGTASQTESSVTESASQNTLASQGETAPTESDSSASGTTTTGFVYHYDTDSVTISGGRTYSVAGYTDSAADTYDFTITGGNNAEITNITEGSCYDDLNRATARYVRVSFAGRTAGSCKLNIYRNGTLEEVVTITVTSTDTNYYTYQTWKKKLQAELWTSDMTALEKLVAFGDYVFSRYDYTSGSSNKYCYALGYGGDCWAASYLLLDLAADLGLEGEPYFVNGSTYGHMRARVWINGIQYDLEASNNTAEPRGCTVVYQSGS
ncbi:MAG: Ig-like domain-containing protein [Clostridiales bacterium]|nr:Ig-like domain-containing protein [Clostridiales bacterium]